MTPFVETMYHKDCATLSTVADQARIFQQQLHAAAGAAQTDDAIDAIFTISNTLADLMDNFSVVMARVAREANRGNDRADMRHARSLRHP